MAAPGIRAWFAAALAAAVLACGGAAAQRREIFREVRVGMNQPITLGERLGLDVRALLQRQEDGRLRLRPGAFSGAAEITVELGADGRVRCVFFDYPPGFSFPRSVREYTEDLGTPTYRTGTPDQGFESARWLNRRTSFVLSRRGRAVRSVLCDRAVGRQRSPPPAGDRTR